jgi:HTH DNA binding domain
LQQLDFEIPLDKYSSGELMDLLQRAEFLHQLRLDTEGYILICRISASELSSYRKSASGNESQKKISVKVLSKEKSGDVLLQVTGRWVTEREEGDWKRSKEFAFFSAMAKAPLFGLETPTMGPSAIRFSIVGAPTKIKQLLSGLKKFNIEYTVHNLSRLSSSNRAMLGELTAQQARILKLAHALGYYEIPRQQKTEDLARILDMDTATVGEHLRRAEKHVFDKLLR